MKRPRDAPTRGSSLLGQVVLAGLLSFHLAGAQPGFSEDLPWEEELANLREQTRIAQQSQTEYLSRITALQAEVTRLTDKNAALQVQLEEQRRWEAQLQQLQAERTELQSRLGVLQVELEEFRRQGGEREQALTFDARAALAQVERLRGELEAAQAGRVQPEKEQDRLRHEEAAPRPSGQRLRQEEAPPGGASSETPLAAPEPEGASTPASAQGAVSTEASQVVIQRVSESRDFFVLSFPETSGFQEGSSLLLSEGERPIAEVELGWADPSGMAVAFVMRALDDLSGLKAGDPLSARQVVRPSSGPSPEGR